MKKKIFLRGILGFPIGVTIGYAISIFISLGWADGSYIPCVPELTEAVGSEVYAVALQALLSGLLGAGFAASSVIWEIEKWSLAKQSGIYFLTISLIMLPIAYVSYWMEHSAAGFFSYFGIFVLIFAVFWVIQFALGKRYVRKMNENLHHVKEDFKQ